MEIKSSNSDELVFHHLKSTIFRMIHCDGFLMSPSPHGDVQMTVYSERLPIPQTTVHAITDDVVNAADLPGRRASRTGIIREVECTLILNEATASGLIKQLESVLALIRSSDND